MKIKLIITLAVFVSIGIFGFNWMNNFLDIDNCLDSGGSWNYETVSCELQTSESERQQQSLDGTVWVSKSIYGQYDSLIFKSDMKVTYHLNEFSWGFRSIYKVEEGILTVLTKTFEIDVEDTNKLDWNLKQQYRIAESTLELIFLANLRNDSWQEAPVERIKKLNKYERIL